MAIKTKPNNVNSELPVEVSLKASISVHEANKKEAFEAMRAYHQSEISHKKDAIEILKTLITTVSFIYTGLIIAVYNHPLINAEYIIYLGWAIFVALVICSSTITYVSNKKITQENKRYVIYMLEYVCEREILNLEQDLLAAGHESHWQKTKNKPGHIPKSGHSYTKYIISGLNIIVCFIGLIGSLIICIAAYTGKATPPNNKPIHIVVDSMKSK